MKYPDKRGWWRFQRKEDFYLLLIVGSGTHFEVAEDDVLARELGEHYDGTPREDNYYEMTNVKELGFADGEWIFERPMRKEGSEMPVVESAPINAHANESDAMAPSANVGETRVNLPPVLDVCCGSRMFWFNKADPRALFVDKRRETHMAKDCSARNGERQIVVDPDVLADFTALPFADDSFMLVVFDPPHIQRNGDTSWLLKKYGVLRGEWREMIRKGFAECFRVLKPEGTLVFKWNEIEIPLSEVLSLTPEKPLFGHRTGKAAKTHWCAFIKTAAASSFVIRHSSFPPC